MGSRFPGLQTAGTMEPAPAQPPPDPRTFVTPLRCIFWGGLLCVLDFNFSQTVNGSGWSFDILNDLVGMLLITGGVFRLGSASTAHGYPGLMGFVKFAAVLSCISALDGHFIYDQPAPVAAAFTLISLLALIATVVFCTAMIRLSRECGLATSERSWGTTRILFVVIYLVPLGFFYAAALVALGTGNSFNLNLGPAGLLLVPVFLIPLIHLFVSTSRMKREAEQVPPDRG